MADNDGADILKTFLNGLDWAGAGLDEPTYYESYERTDTYKPNSIIFTETSILPERSGHGKYYLTHNVLLEFKSDTKQNSYDNLIFVIKNIYNYTGDVEKKMELQDITTEYSRKRKHFRLVVEIRELKSL